MPRVIDVQLHDGANVDFDELSRKLEATVPGISLESHEQWLNTLLVLFRSVEFVAILIILLISTVTLAAIVFTTRSVLAVHYEIVEVLLIGAQDTYIADQFQKHAFRMGLKGSVGGTASALATIIGIALLTNDLETSLLPPTTLAYWHWLLLAMLPIGESYGAMLTARFTILRALRRMS